jgi:hypothetical protein
MNACALTREFVGQAPIIFQETDPGPAAAVCEHVFGHMASHVRQSVPRRSATGWMDNPRRPTQEIL